LMVDPLDHAGASLLAGSRELVERGEVPRPALALLRKGRHVGAVFGRAGEDRHKVLTEMLMLAVAARADALVLVQDAWTSSRPLKDEEEIVPPSEDPGAIEAIIEVRAAKGQPMVMVLHPYFRKECGAVRFGEPTRLEGTLAGVIPDLLAGALVAKPLDLSVEAIARLLTMRGHHVVLHGVG
jgi:hypothetical protein